MQRLNRSAHAPVGTAFLLFIGLAILPVSLRAAGVQVSFSPRLSAAMDAWQQMAEVFGVSYGPGTASDLSVVKDLDSEPANSIDGPVSPCSEFASAREELAERVLDLCEGRAVKAAPERPASPKSASRHSLASKRATSAVVASFEDHKRLIGAAGAMKLEMLAREDVLKNIGMQVFRKSFDPIIEIRSLPISKSMRVQVRMKRGVAPSATKTAECKVFSALASARRHECERAMLTTISTSPDNSEF